MEGGLHHQCPPHTGRRLACGAERRCSTMRSPCMGWVGRRLRSLPRPRAHRRWPHPTRPPQAALGDKAKNGAHTIFVEKEGEKFALGTLDRERCTHFSLDIHIATDSITISHTGKSDVYITGYEAISVNAEEDSPFPWQQPGGEQGVVPLARGAGEGAEAWTAARPVHSVRHGASPLAIERPLRAGSLRAGMSDGDEESSEEEEEAPQGVPIPAKVRARPWLWCMGVAATSWRCCLRAGPRMGRVCGPLPAVGLVR